MSTLAGEFWVCGDCRSINNAGARQCYNCRTPRDRAAVDPNDIDPSTHGRLREIELPEFRSSRWAAMLASILILAVAVMQVVQSNLAAALLNQMLGGVDATEEQILYVGSVTIVAFGVALLALIAWALWLSRTVTAMPALGLGYPAANGMMAFIENFIPVLNLWRVPAIVRDVVRRLEPKTGGEETMTRGESLVFAAWISIFAGYIVPRVLGFLTSDIRTLITISGIGTGLVVVGAIFLVVLIWWIEGRILRRREMQLAEAAGPVSTGADDAAGATAAPEPPTLAMPDAVQTRSAFAATPSAPPSGASSFRLPGIGAAAEPPPAREPAAEPASQPEPEPEPGHGVAPAGTIVEAAVRAPVAPEPVVEPHLPAAQDLVAAPEATGGAGATVSPGPSTPPLPDQAATPSEPLAGAMPDAAGSPPSAPALTPEPAAEPTPVAATPAGPPNLTIRVSSRGMMTAEMDGELEHVMLDDLGSYAEALSGVGGTATIVVPSDDGMAGLISKRAQRILEDAGVRVTIA
jgi:hypothetical protein